MNNLEKLIDGSFGILLNANDLFELNHTYAINISSEDLEWVLPIFNEFGWDGVNAVLSYIEEKEVLPKYQTEKFTKAYLKLITEKPEIYS